jgi:uncharacterized protein YjbJ (UPF0337 family)
LFLWGGFIAALSSCPPFGEDARRNLSLENPLEGVDDQMEESVINWDQIKGNWKQFQGKARQQWGKLTDDDFDEVQGEREQLIGRVQER